MVLFEVTLHLKKNVHTLNNRLCNVNMFVNNMRRHIENVKPTQTTRTQISNKNLIEYAIISNAVWMVLFIPCHTVPFSFQNAIEIHYMHVLFLFTYSCVDCTVQFSDIDQSSWLNVSHQFVLQLHSINKGKIMTKCHSTHTHTPYAAIVCVLQLCHCYIWF